MIAYGKVRKKTENTNLNVSFKPCFKSGAVGLFKLQTQKNKKNVKVSFIKFVPFSLDPAHPSRPQGWHRGHLGGVATATRAPTVRNARHASRIIVYVLDERLVRDPTLRGANDVRPLRAGILRVVHNPARTAIQIEALKAVDDLRASK